MSERLIGDDELEVEAAPVPDAGELKQIAALAAEYLALEDVISEIEQRLAAKKLALKTLREHQLPLALTEVGMESFRLVGGGEVKLKNMVSGGVSEANQREAFAALEKNGHGGIIKHEIKILFGKGEEAWAKKFLRDMEKRKRPLNAQRKDFIAPQTLGAFVREQVKEFESRGLDPQAAMPDDLYRLLGVYRMRYAEVTPPKIK